MDKRIIEITTDLFVKLPANVASFTQSDLSKAGFPPFLVKRVLFHTYNRVLDTIHLPDQLWLSWDSDELLQAREELLKVIKKEVRIPSDIAKEIIRQAVKECLEMTIQPRRSISKYLFGDEIELELKAIAGRASSITVNRYLIWSLIRYMERKEKVSVTREQADHILGKIDEKIVQNYHPLNWLSLVKPLFDMAGTKVHTDLIRLFFEDKRNNRAAKQFDMLNKTISETQFIEVMSSPDLLNVEGFRDDQQALFQEPVSGKSVNEDAENHKFMQSADEKDNASLPVEEEPDLPERFEEPSDTVAPWIDEEEEEVEVDEEEKEKEEVIGDVSGDERTLNDVLQADKKENEEDQEAEEQEESFADESLEEEDLSPDQTLLETEDMDSGGKDEIGVEAIEISDSDEDDESPISKSEVDDGDDTQNEDEDLTLANRFMFDESDLENDLSRNLSVDDDNDDEEEETSTIYDDLNLTRKDTVPTTLDLFESDVDFNFSDDRSETDKKVDSDLELPGKEETSESRESTKGKEDPTPVEDDDSDSESDLPMWRSFLEREDVDSGSSFEFDDSDYSVEESEISSGGPDDETETETETGTETGMDTETETETEMDVEDKERLDEDGFIEEPIYDLTKEEPAIEQKIGGLNEWMLDEKDTFIEELFGDSEDAYEQALADIIEFEDWKQASRYIEKEIFTRNRIDVYDEIAVDFTDRLHSYFLENKS